MPSHPGPVPNQWPSVTPCQLAFIGENPGPDEVRLNQPFSGAAGRYLNRALARVGVDREACYIGNTCRYKPSATSNEFSVLNWTEDVVQEGIATLLEELRRFHPNLVVALGNVPLHLFRHGNVDPGKTPKSGFKWVSRVSTWRGSLFLSHESLGEPRIKCLCAYHPMFILRAPSKGFDFKQDMSRAREEMGSPGLDLLRVTIEWGPREAEEEANPVTLEPLNL